MDWNLFWNAFGAIGTTLGTFVTAITMLLAYMEYRLSKETRFKVRIKSVKVCGNESDNYDKFLVIHFYNKGKIDLLICNISVKAFGKEYNIENYIESERKLNNSREEFPIKVTNFESANVAITYEKLYSIIEYIENENDRKIRYLKFFVSDGTGNKRNMKVKINKL